MSYYLELVWFLIPKNWLRIDCSPGTTRFEKGTKCVRVSPCPRLSCLCLSAAFKVVFAWVQGMEIENEVTCGHRLNSLLSWVTM